MAQQLVLYIRSQFNNSDTLTKVDMYKDEKVSLTMTLQDIRDIEKVRTDFTQPFTLPASDENNKLFQHWYNPDIDGYNSNFRSPAVLELNYLPFRTGFVTLNSVKMRDGNPEFYNVTFLGETVDLKNVISEDQLDQLTWLNSAGFLFTNDNNSARQGLNTGLDKSVDGVTYQDAFIYPLISHSVAFNYVSNPNPAIINYTNLWSNTAQTQSGVYYNDLKPAIKVDLILKAIEETYGLKFSTDFFFTSATENLYLWMSRNKGFMQGGGRLDTAYKNSTCSGTPDSCDYFAAIFDPSYGTQCQYSGQPSFEIQVQGLTVAIELGTDYEVPDTDPRRWRTTWVITPTAASANFAYDWQIFDNENNIVMASQQATSGTNTIVIKRGNQLGGAYNIQNSELVGNYYSAAYSLEVQSAEPFEFDLTLKMEAAVRLATYFNTGQGCFPYVQSFGFLANYVPNAGTFVLEVDVVPTQQLPEIKTLDFLTGLFKTYNLTAFFEDGIIVVKPLDEFYSASTKTWDLTKMVHSDKHSIDEALPFSEVNFLYAEPKTIVAQKFEQINNRRYGELRYVADASKQGTYKIQSPFEHMVYERMSDITTGTQTTLQQGTFLDDNLNASFGKPLLFYAVYQDDTVNGTPINWINGVRPNAVASQPVAGTRQPFNRYWTVSTANSLGSPTVPPDITLNFGSEVNTWSLTDYGGNNNSLFQNYYQNYITRVFDSRNRLFKFKVKLPLEFLLNFSLADKVKIGNREFTINKVTADLTTGESTMELLNIF
jgi:hypothetical protein